MTDLAMPSNVRMAEYVLGLLDPPDSAAMERSLRDSTELRTDYHFWITRLATLNTAYKPQVTPLGYHSIAARLFGTPRAKPVPFWLKLGAVAVAAVIIAVKIEVIILIIRYLTQ